MQTRRYDVSEGYSLHLRRQIEELSRKLPEAKANLKIDPVVLDVALLNPITTHTFLIRSIVQVTHEKLTSIHMWYVNVRWMRVDKLQSIVEYSGV